MSGLLHDAFREAVFDFDESKHPRDAHGRFGPGDGDTKTDTPVISVPTTLADAPPQTKAEIEDRVTDPPKELSPGWRNAAAWELIETREARGLDDPRREYPERYAANKGFGTDLRQGEIETKVDQRNTLKGGDTTQPPRLFDISPIPEGMSVDAAAKAGYEGLFGYGTSVDGRPNAIVPGSERPPEALYRVMSEDEYQGALRNGYIQSDERMNFGHEGTVTSLKSTGSFYVPGTTSGDQAYRIARLGYRDADGWRLDSDGYVKTDGRVPIDRIQAITEPLPNPRAADTASSPTVQAAILAETFASDPNEPEPVVVVRPAWDELRGSSWTTFDYDEEKHPKGPDDDARTASGDFDESKHPRDAHGRFGPGDDGEELSPQKQETDAALRELTGGKLGYRDLDAMLRDGLPPGVTVGFRADRGDMGSRVPDGSSVPGVVAIRGSYYDSDHRQVGEFTRRIGGYTPSMTMVGFELDAAHQGQGIARSHYEAMAKLAQAADVDRLSLVANISSGAYAWAKFGFVPSIPNEIRNLTRAADAAGVDPRIGTTLRDAVEDFTRHIPYEARQAAIYAIADDPHGKDALIGTSWAGDLDMTDPVAMARFNSYVQADLPVMDPHRHAVAAAGSPGEQPVRDPQMRAEPHDQHGNDDWIWAQADRSLPAAGDFDESKHPRDSHGRFGPCDGEPSQDAIAHLNDHAGDFAAAVDDSHGQLGHADRPDP